MTITIHSQAPTNESWSLSQRPLIVLSLHGTDVIDPLRVDEVSLFVDGGQVTPDRISTNSSHGVDLRHLVAKLSLGEHTFRVKARDLDSTWGIGVVDRTGPIVDNFSPAIGSDGEVSRPVIEFHIHDQAGIQIRTNKVPSVIGSRSGTVLTTDEINFTGSEGLMMSVNSVPEVVRLVHGPHAVHTTSDGTGSLLVELHDDTGLDITINGVAVMRSGFDLSAGWRVDLGEIVEGLSVAVVRTGEPLPVGEKVNVHVRVRDSSEGRRNVSEVSWFFYVGDVTPPVVSSFSPTPGSFGLSRSETTIQMKITDPMSDVALSSIQIYIDEDLVVEDGVGTGEPYDVAVSKISGGYLVSVTRDEWPEKQILMNIEASDSIGNQCVESVNLSFTDSVISEEVIENEDICRIVPFDLSGTAFCSPVTQRLTGAGFDGFIYADGTSTGEHASWGELAPFPQVGYLVVSRSGWTIQTAAGDTWMSAGRPMSGWSAGGTANIDLRDGDIGDRPALFLLMAAEGFNALIVVDFQLDTVSRSTVDGLELGLLSLSDVDGDQSGGNKDTRLALPVDVSFSAIAGRAWGSGSWVAALGGGEELVLLGALDEESITDIRLSRRTQIGDNFEPHVRRIQLESAYTRQICMTTGPLPGLQRLLCARSISEGESQLVQADWILSFISTHSPYVEGFDVDILAIDQAVDASGNWCAMALSSEEILLLDVTVNAFTVREEYDRAYLEADGLFVNISMASGWRQEAGTFIIGTSEEVIRAEYPKTVPSED